MAQNVTVQGASYADVPAVVLPKTGGGTASFTDVSDTTAAAGDVASGKYFYTAAGQRTEGTASGGGGQAYEDLLAVLAGTFSGAFANSDITIIKGRGFSNCPNMTSLSLPNLTQTGDRPFDGTTNLTSINTPNITNAAGYYLTGQTHLSGGYIFPALTTCAAEFVSGATITSIVVPALTSMGTNFANGNGALVSADFTNLTKFMGWAFRNTTAFTTLILRKPSIIALDNVNVFVGSKFDSGGAGGTIYIPESLYNHLGDGTSSDYKAATNWSTVNAYGTITWAKIEGSQYENYYADGTPIPSS